MARRKLKAPKGVKIVKAPSFRKGQTLRRKYRWPGEKKKDYYYKVTKVDKSLGGAKVKHTRVVTNGKSRKIKGTAYLHKYTAEIGKVTPKKGWGRTTVVKIRRKK